jgi:N-acetylneuraminic acid mutarotase
MINLLEERFENPLSSGTTPTPRENFSMQLISKRLFIFGGFQEGGVMNDLYSIDMISLVWSKVETQGPQPTARQGMASARVGKKIYVSSGCDFRAEKCYTDTYILDIDSLWWTRIDNK